MKRTCSFSNKLVEQFITEGQGYGNNVRPMFLLPGSSFAQRFSTITTSSPRHWKRRHGGPFPSILIEVYSSEQNDWQVIVGQRL
jgi:hypothetical protein